MANEKYCTLDELKQALPGSGIDHVADIDAFLVNAIIRASRAIDRFTRREDGAYARASTDEETRLYDGSGEPYQWVDEMASAPTAVAVAETGGRSSSDYTSYSSSDYMLWPYNATQIPEPYRRIDIDELNGSQSVFYRFPQSVKVTALFGYSTTDNTPPEITQATIVQAARWFGRAKQGYQDTGAIVDLGQLRYTQRLDPEVAEIIDHFRRVVV